MKIVPGILIFTIAFLLTSLLFLTFVMPNFAREQPSNGMRPDETFKEYIEREDLRWLKYNERKQQ